MKIGLAQIIQESNTFSPFKTELKDFYNQYFYLGKNIYSGFKNTKLELNGMIDVLKANKLEHIPLLATHGSCSGPLTRECFSSILKDLKKVLLAAPKLDGLLLALHGSLSIEDEPDGESEILELIQRIISKNIPIGVSLDLHGHITERMLKKNIFYIGYKTYPHIDMYATGKKTAKILISTLNKEIKPKMVLSKLPLIISPVCGRTDEGPMKSIYDDIQNFTKNDNILDVSCFMVQPWLDYNDLGFAALVCSNNDMDKAKIVSDSICDKVWKIRNTLVPDLTQLVDAIEVGLSSRGTTVIGDCGDAPSGGSAGDNPTILKTLLDLGLDKVDKNIYLTLVDPRAAKAACNSGVGTELKLELGHYFSKDEGKPLKIKARVKAITDGSFKIKHGLEGVEMQFGLTTLLTIGSISIAVRSYGGLEWDVGQYTSVGLDLKDASIVFVKSPSHFRAGYSSHSDQIIIADTPGSTCCDIKKIKYQNIKRQVHPLDEI